jgi:hypothetical protein
MSRTSWGNRNRHGCRCYKAGFTMPIRMQCPGVTVLAIPILAGSTRYLR